MITDKDKLTGPDGPVKIKEEVKIAIKTDPFTEIGNEIEIATIKEGILTGVTTVFINEVDTVEFEAYEVEEYIGPEKTPTKKHEFIVSIKTKTETWMHFDHSSNALEVYNAVVGLRSGRLVKPEEKDDVHEEPDA